MYWENYDQNRITLSGLFYRLIVLFVVLSFLGCSKQHLITGEPLVYGVNPLSGEVLDRDTVTKLPGSAQGIIPHQGEIVTIVANSIFIKFLKDLGSPHVLVYAQVFDDGTDDPSNAFTRIIYHERDTPSGVNLGLSDKVLYGPTPFKGYPIRIKFYIIELDKEEKETASNIINTVGTTAAAARPDAAVAINVAVQIAEAINALNNDDYELRFDLTLYPVDQIGTADVANAPLASLTPPEPVQRQGKPVSLVSSLRTGPYLILKRELPERFGKQENVPVESLVDFDFSQEYFISSYQTPDGGMVHSSEVLRYQGGYLYRIVTGLTDANEQPLQSTVVRPRRGANRFADVSLAPGIRQRFDDRTYVVLSVLTGLPLGVSSEAARQSSERDVAQILSLLDNPERESERIGERIDNIGSSVKALLEQRRVAEVASRRVGRTPAFRTNVDYALFWTQQIDPLTNYQSDTQEKRNAISRNTGILYVLTDLIENLPILDPANQNQMNTIKQFNTSSFVAVQDDRGMFRLTDQAVSSLL